MDVSIIIVNYNTCKLTVECIQSVYDSQLDYQYEIFVVDNASVDGSVLAIRQSFSNVTVIANKENVGFSRANNQAIRAAKGRYILLLNSDTVVQENTIYEMLQFMDKNDNIGASGCKVVLPDGSLDQACHRGFPTPAASFYYMTGFAKRYPNNPTFTGYHLTYLNMDETHEIDCLVGAYMLVRRKAIEQAGLLDETFFMYGEDIDWCYRIKEAGWKIVYYPLVSIIHYKGASSRKKPFKIIYEFHRAMYLFHKYHYAKKYPFIINWVVYGGISLKFLLTLSINSVKKVSGGG